MKIKYVIMMVVVSFLLISIYSGNIILQNYNLVNAVESSDIEQAQCAIDLGANVNARKSIWYIPQIVPTNPTPLIIACKSGDREMVEFLIANDADVNKVCNYTGETPLLAALHGTKQNRFSLAMYLIENGANIYVTQTVNSAFNESLMVLDTDSDQTIEEGFELFRHLIENGVDRTIYMTKESALTFAAHYRNDKAVEYLIQNDYFVVNELDSNGDTALIVAARHGRVTTVGLLLSLGADVSITDRNGKTAYDNAMENGFSEVVSILG